MPFSLLLAPLLFYLHTTFVLGLLRGRVTPWISPSRNPGETLPLRTAVKMFWLPGIAALGLTALAWCLVPSFLVHLLTIIVGWMLAIPLATWNSMPQKSPTIWSERIRVLESNFLRHFELGAENRTPSFRSPSRCRNQWSKLRTDPVPWRSARWFERTASPAPRTTTPQRLTFANTEDYIARTFSRRRKAYRKTANFSR